MRKLASNPPPSRGLQLLLPDMEPLRDDRDTPLLKALKYTPLLKALKIGSKDDTKRSAVPSLTQSTGGGLFMRPEAQILAVHDEAARLRISVAARSIRVALVMATEWIDRSIETAKNRAALRSCLSASSHFYSEMQVRLGPITGRLPNLYTHTMVCHISSKKKKKKILTSCIIMCRREQKPWIRRSPWPMQWTKSQRTHPSLCVRMKC